MNPATVAPARPMSPMSPTSPAADAAAGPTDAAHAGLHHRRAFSVEDVTCAFTVKACACLSLDAVCCLALCMGCGGCCGRYQPCVMSLEGVDGSTPGPERCQAVCAVQCMAAMVMPATLCGCLWGCCGTCTPCAKSAVGCVMGVEDAHAAKAAKAKAPVPEVGMAR